MVTKSGQNPRVLYFYYGPNKRIKLLIPNINATLFIYLIIYSLNLYSKIYGLMYIISFVCYICFFMEL